MRISVKSPPGTEEKYPATAYISLRADVKGLPDIASQSAARNVLIAGVESHEAAV
jgi:hypothetical protein